MRTVRKLACVLAVAGLVAGCSSGDDDADDDEGATTVTTTEAEAGPVATFAALDGGNGMFLGTAGGGPDLDAAGFTEAEYTTSGTATSYTGEQPTDGRFVLEPADEATLRATGTVPGTGPVKILTSCPSCLQGLSRYTGDLNNGLLEADYIVVEMANRILGPQWMPEYVERANDGGIERVLV